MYIYAECHILKLNTNTTLISKTLFPDYFIFSLCNRYYVKGKFQIFGEIQPYLKLAFSLVGWILPSNGKFSEMVTDGTKYEKNLRDKIIPKVMVFATFCVFFCLQKQAQQPPVPISTPL